MRPQDAGGIVLTLRDGLLPLLSLIRYRDSQKETSETRALVRKGKRRGWLLAEITDFYPELAPSRP
jgi:hypothetical protein